MRDIDLVVSQIEAVSEIQKQESIIKIGANLFNKSFDSIKEHQQVIYCGECEYRYDAHYESDGEQLIIKSQCMCKGGLSRDYRIEDWDFCSRGRLIGTVDKPMLRAGEEENYDRQRARRR